MIESIKLFRQIDEEGKKAIEALLQSKEFRTGQVIYNEGDPGGSLNFVVKGKVRVCKITKEGKPFCIASLGEGDIFGVMSFLDGSRHDATIQADALTILVTLSREDFDSLLSTNTLLAATVLKNLAMHLASIVRTMNVQYMDLMQYMFQKS